MAVRFASETSPEAAAQRGDGAKVAGHDVQGPPGVAEGTSPSSGSGPESNRNDDSRPSSEERRQQRSAAVAVTEKRKFAMKAPDCEMAAQLRSKASWQTSEGDLRPSIAGACENVAKEYASYLPRTHSETRFARIRVPKTHLEQLLKQGEPPRAVAVRAAVQCVESWVHILFKEKVFTMEMSDLVARFVHDGLIAVPEPLLDALKKLVPRLDNDLMEGWPFIDSLIESREMEGEFDRASFVHSKDMNRLRAACGGVPPVWMKPDRPRSNLSRAAYETMSGFRQTTYLLGGGEQDLYYLPRPKSVPDPGVSRKALRKEGLHIQTRGAFNSTGALRPLCLVSPLNHFPRRP